MKDLKITIEGPLASGKSALAGAIAEVLSNHGIKHSLCKEEIRENTSDYWRRKIKNISSGRNVEIITKRTKKVLAI